MFYDKPDMNIREMIRLCKIFSGIENNLVQIIAHEIRAPYEYVDFYNLNEEKPRSRHRIRKLMGKWKMLY